MTQAWNRSGTVDEDKDNQEDLRLAWEGTLSPLPSLEAIWEEKAQEKHREDMKRIETAVRSAVSQV